jgi:hypothetical protein
MNIYNAKIIASTSLLLFVAMITPSAFAAGNTFDSDPVSAAGPIPTDGTWNPIVFEAPLTPPVDAPYTFDCSGSCLLTVVDGFIPIDRFDVEDDGNPLGSTSVPDEGGAGCDDPDECLSQGDHSSGTFCLSSGTHSISLVDTDDDEGSIYPAGAWLKVEESQCGESPVAGELLAIDNSALLLVGLQSSAIWMIPAFAVIAGTGAYIVKSRMQKA